MPGAARRQASDNRPKHLQKEKGSWAFPGGHTPAANCAKRTSGRRSFSTAGSTPTAPYNDQIFVDLRDRYGVTQVVFEADQLAKLFADAQEVRNEWVLAVRGKVRARLPGKHNPKLPPATWKCWPTTCTILNRCPTPPFEVMSVPLEGQTSATPNWPTRICACSIASSICGGRRLQRTLALRHRLNKVIRDYLDSAGLSRTGDAAAGP